MSAVAMLTLAFVSIAVVGTALAAVHDVIAAALARVGAEAVRPEPLQPHATAGMRRLEQTALRTTPLASPVRVRARCVDGVSAAGARA